jgi:DNA polymerase V
MYALVDGNNFYWSCECVFNPSLWGQYGVVASLGDGCAISRSAEVKPFLPMGANIFEYKDLIREKKIKVFSPNFALYGDMSNRMHSLLSGYSPDVEYYSIDECFIKFDGYERYDLPKLALEIHAKIPRYIGIPVGVGMGPTKALAKVANKVAKKFTEQTKGCYVIDTEEKRIKALKWLPIEDVWGIGRQHAARLKAIGIHRAYDFTQLSDDYVRKNLTVVGLRLKKDLEGIPTLDIDEIEPKKNMACTRSFEKNYTDKADLVERVSTFANHCGEKLRKQNSCCQAIQVFLHTNTHRQDLDQYNGSTVLKLPFPTNSSLEIVHFALMALDKIYKPGYAYKKAGVVVLDFSPADNVQIDLFNNSDYRHKELMKAVDTMNDKYGMQKIRLASQDLDRIWKMKQGNLSPRYTTNLKDVIRIKT